MILTCIISSPTSRSCSTFENLRNTLNKQGIMMFLKSGLFLALLAIAFATPIHPRLTADDEGLAEFEPMEDIVFEPVYLIRVRREVEINPHVNKQDGTTNAGASVTHRGDRHEVTAHWNKNVAGPGRARPNYGVRGSWKF